MKQLQVEADHPYSVHIGAGAFDLFADAYRSLLDAADQIVVIADERVAELHLSYLLDFLTDWDVRILTIPAGESAKSVETFMSCHSFLLSENCSRDSLLLAFGGGATGDVAGFVASTFMRGIPFIQLPTTILAHDSAVGGKTAINHELGKNMIGTFYQPKAVLYDSKLLSTLPPGEVRSGMAEVIKHAFISNEKWLEDLLAIRDFSSLTEEDLNHHLEKGIAVKAAIVEEDEFESGVRKYLNFGHTLAHALEGHLGYGKLTHGEAVVLGMSYALLLSEHSKLDKFISWSVANGYPLQLLGEIHFDALLPYMKKDKKSSKGQLNFVLLKQTGKPFIEKIEVQRASAAYEKLVLQIGEVI
ncbi:3-dehydroquinate synthase [Planococcus antarcticus DSM 14505]|uniref:3-dehydroquinate synthase n=1 Tax=Planococcus antarcticus DSM 14505 TaxID=1185653 RepID=A0A1C7DGH7_9BACL|nr:3-dehydroquinate synthase [Planococcus antarcticus]ANU10669.1 3-dehydroquinate synthase [Planococcus antarcticus DSM 14505]EIM06756.1 3-dehydroquinate synthase [Planococcus antarcticus DSM 14505]